MKNPSDWKHLRYLWYVIRHKWFVFLAGTYLLRMELANLFTLDGPVRSNYYGKPVYRLRSYAYHLGVYALVFVRLLIHDWSKFLPSEWRPYVWTFYGGYDYDDRPRWLAEWFDRAWLHHQHLNKHHWQHWVLREDRGPAKAVEMPLWYVIEMLADWMGAGRAITGQWGVWSWYHGNKKNQQLHRNTRYEIERRLLALHYWMYDAPPAEGTFAWTIAAE